MQTSANVIGASYEVRVFLFPLTSWQGGTTCSCSRSDGTLVVCSVERMSYNTNTLYLVMDQNAAGIGYDTMNVLTVTLSSGVWG